MSQFGERDVYSVVTLVDRAGRGGAEIIYDGVRLTTRPNQIEMAVPRFVAEWLFSKQKYMVWTEDGEYTCRFGIKDAPEELLAYLGPESGVTTPIAIDGNRTEGWDTTGVDRKDTRVVPVSVPSHLTRERQGGRGETRVDFGARKE